MKTDVIQQMQNKLPAEEDIKKLERRAKSNENKLEKLSSKLPTQKKD